MNSLPLPLQKMAEYPQWILYKLIPQQDGKTKKLPINPHTLSGYPKGEDWQSDPANMTTHANAVARATEGLHVGFLFTERDPFFFLDIDHCLNPDGTSWTDVAMTVMGALPGAAVEISQSGSGLHIFGSGTCPEHGCKNIPYDLELYTEKRFVALTGKGVIGDVAKDMSAYLPRVVDTWFPPRVQGSMEWTDGPCEGWTGPEDDEELIAKMLSTASAAAVFGGGSSIQALWNRDEDALAIAYPSQGESVYDGSSADAALAQHLAFWTGKDCERMDRLMRQSGLVRDKWEREDYLQRTITFAVSLQEEVYSVGAPGDNTIADSYGAPKLRANSDAQRAYAENMRTGILQVATEEQRALLCPQYGPTTNAKFWIDNQEKTPVELVEMVKPVETSGGGRLRVKPEVVTGLMLLTADKQLEHFDGCVYVQDAHRVFTPSGSMLKPDQFNATYGGYIFHLDSMGDKTTKKAWEAFTESQVIRWPIADSTCFRPEVDSGSIVQEESWALVNTYVPIHTERVPGDVAPFLAHLQKLLPIERDRDIVLSYMAACVQHIGVKFQWAPILQGVKGNGKTMLTRCVAAAVGHRYTHMPHGAEVAEKFNEWLFGKIFIGVEEILVPDNKREVMEVLKPMITNERLAMRAMQRAQVMGDNRANFIFNTNYKDAVKVSADERRFAVFYTAQQTYEDLVKDGMADKKYFPELYQWLNRGGYAAVTDFLHNYDIPSGLNPALIDRAPDTSSKAEAISAGLGRVEQAILESVEEGRVGFAGDWISSVHLDRLLVSLKADRAIPHNRRREMLQDIGYDLHPGLKGGRATCPIMLDDGKKPRLYIKMDNMSLQAYTKPAEIVDAYVQAQEKQNAEQVFDQK